MEGKKYSVTEYAKLIGRTRQRVLQMIKEGTLKAEMIGKTYVIYF